jgi:hypothetical protein
LRPPWSNSPLPRGETRERHGRRLDVIEPPRLRRAFAGLDHRVFGEGAALRAEHDIDRVAALGALDAGAGALHDTGSVAAQRERQLVRTDISAPPYLVVDRVGAGGMDAQENLILTRLRHRCLLDLDHLGPAEAMDAHCLHHGHGRLRCCANQRGRRSHLPRGRKCFRLIIAAG